MAKSKSTRSSRKTPKKGPSGGTGGKGRRGLEGKGATPKAKDRPHHKAYQKPKATATSRSPRSESSNRSKNSKISHEIVFGRNSVVEVLREEVPAKSLHLAENLEPDPRLREALQLATSQGLAIIKGTKAELDRMTNRATHQGVVLRIEPYEYADPAELLDADQPLIVVLDSITDPRNLGAIARSAVAFGATGIVVGQRRGVGVTASAWKTSAGALSRIKVAQAVNITRQLQQYKDAGLFVIGLSADGDLIETQLDKELAARGLVLVVGAEGDGLSRLISEQCDFLFSIPMTNHTESLNASVAAAIALYEIAKIRSV